jgi:hypothetical protein
MITRRAQLSLLAGAFVATVPAISAEKDNSAMFKELFEASMKDKKGLMVYVKGQAIAGVVTKVAGDAVELRSREYSRIIVRMDAVDAVAMA